MAKKYIFVRVPMEVHQNLLKGKVSLEQEVQKIYGKKHKLTMPKYLNALQLKNNQLIGLIPFNIKKIAEISRKGRGQYE